MIAVDGANSDDIVLRNMIFQGTVLGPTLWNLFFSDLDDSVSGTDHIPHKFADDVSTTKTYEYATTDAAIYEDLGHSQSLLHAWGDRNRVSFDAVKEKMMIISTTGDSDSSFRLLGPIIDCRLRMHHCIDKLYRKSKPKARSILRCAAFYDLPSLLLLFKSHCRSQIEWANGAIYHAAKSLLSRIDSVQTSFCEHLNLNVASAFLEFNLAPLQLRRDIGMLGVLWKVSRKSAHSDMCNLFPLRTAPRPTNVVTRSMSRRLHLLFIDQCDGSQLDIFARSLFGLIRVWNSLPDNFVLTSSVKDFQKLLTHAARNACWRGESNWDVMFSPSAYPGCTLLRKYCWNN